MSAQALQRVVVRMLFDPAFRAQVYADPVGALRDVDLSAEERQWAVQPPAPAYGADGHRQSRALSGLLEEYPVAGALAVRCRQGLERLRGFFASPAFHQCVQGRGCMADVFGDYLQGASFPDGPEIAWMARIEQGIVRVRRAPDLPQAPAGRLTPATLLRLAPWIALLRVPPNTLPRYSALLTRLRGHRDSLLHAVLDAAYKLPKASPRQRQATQWVLIEGGAGRDGPSLEIASRELGDLLWAAQNAVSFEHLGAVACRLGATPDEACGLIEDLCTDRLLIRVASS